MSTPCLQVLKENLHQLRTLFPAGHERFQVTNATVDEISCCFIGPKGEKIVINGNIMESYPECPPVWFSDSEEAVVSQTLSLLCDTTGKQNMVLPQVYMLVKSLCTAYNLTHPSQLAKISQKSQSSNSSVTY